MGDVLTPDQFAARIRMMALSIEQGLTEPAANDAAALRVHDRALRELLAAAETERDKWKAWALRLYPADSVPPQPQRDQWGALGVPVVPQEARCPTCGSNDPKMRGAATREVAGRQIPWTCGDAWHSLPQETEAG